MAEFTGERLIPGQVDADLLNEHMARYAFAARLARGKRVLDAGCGAGYGSAELAREADQVTGLDRAAEAVQFARSHYALPNLAFQQASCEALPHLDGSFDLVVAFEVIEHLERWRDFLLEARRVLARTGQFIVSTPNKMYYTESRGPDGANPYHVHEFTFEEFQAELTAVFPHVAMFLENHVEGVVFQPHAPADTVAVRVEPGDPEPDASHFFVAVCAHRAQLGKPTFVYVPNAGNVLRERERHIALLESEVEAKDGWLKRSQEEHQDLLDKFHALGEDLERSNRWADELNRELGERRARIAELQDELAREQENARKVAEGYAAKVASLEEEQRQTAVREQAQTEDLARAVEALHRVEKELDERTGWALRLDGEARKLEGLLGAYRSSRWVRLGRKIGLGPAG